MCLRKKSMILLVLHMQHLRANFYNYRWSGFHGYELIRLDKSIQKFTAQEMKIALQHAFEVAYANPSFWSLRNYLRLHKEHLLKSETFANMWQKVVWRDGAFDENIAFPISQIGRSLHVQKKLKGMQAFLKKAARDFKLVVFVDQHEESEIVRQICGQYATELGWRIEYIEKKNRGGVWKSEQIPVIYVASDQNHKIVRIGGGALSLYDLMVRVMATVEEYSDSSAYCA